MRLLRPFGPAALPKIKVLRTVSTSSGVRTIMFYSELRTSGIKFGGIVFVSFNMV